MKGYIPYTLVSLALVACGGGDDTPQPTVMLYKYKESLTCVPGSGISLELRKQQLTDQGIPVLSSTCGKDGDLQPAMIVCNQITDEIGIVEVADENKRTAEKFGFKPLFDLLFYKKVDCDSGVVIPGR